MPSTSPGSFRLFQAFGINVFVHWSWFVVALIMYQLGGAQQPLWFAAIYLTLFAIVTVHEFGHALACRSVGGHAHRIILWPLGGIAFVSPPPRPGAMLWSIAAGPLVNVALVPVTIGLLYLFQVPLSSLLDPTSALTWSTWQWFIVWVFRINAMLLAFNLLPIYPLDGGQILQSILWFFLGQAKSLTIATVIGMIAAVAGGAYFLVQRQWYMLAIAVFIGFEAYQGFQIARHLAATQQGHARRASQIGADRRGL